MHSIGREALHLIHTHTYAHKSPDTQKKSLGIVTRCMTLHVASPLVCGVPHLAGTFRASLLGRRASTGQVEKDKDYY